MKPTKGNWKTVGAFVISEIKDNSWDDTPKISICSTANVNNLPLGEQIANARLIAAAPDLLKACKRKKKVIIAAFGIHAWDTNYGYMEDAIAKAEIT